MIININVKSTKEILKHKLSDGLQTNERFCFWKNKKQFNKVVDIICPKKSINYIPDKIREAASLYDIIGYPECWIWRDNVLNIKEAKTGDWDIEVRLYFIIDDIKQGYFKCFGANADFTELWFHSEDWIPSIKVIQ